MRSSRSRSWTRMAILPEMTGKDGIKGYLKWAAIHRANAFLAQLGRVMPIQINAVAKTETKTVVRYETVAERRAAMIAEGWSPTVLAAMEEAMEPKFLRDLRAEKAKQVKKEKGEAN